jgi:toxin ParE1/3/4
MSVRRTQQADGDIEDIARYISLDSPMTAISWLEGLEAKLEAMGLTPGLGVSRPEVRAELRSFAFDNYLILYRKVEYGAEIVRVLHGARDWQKLL